MPEISPRLSLPYLMPAQAQKHVTHNEALTRLDILVQLMVEAFDATVPPETPENGMAWALGTGAAGAWSGRDGLLAAWVDNAWLFLAPAEGWLAWDRAEGRIRAFAGGGWQVPGAVPQQVARLGIGTAADAANRLAVASPATLLTHAGAGHRVSVNKAATPETASVIFSSDWTGHAELGLSGGDDLTVRTSADGTAWTTALTVARGTGAVGIGIAAPARPLHVDRVLRIEPGAAPASPAAGDLYFDAATAKLRCHDGTAWRDLF